MTPPIRLIASDLDGTFLNSDRAISAEHRVAVELARQAGVVFCLASGRAINTIYPFAESLGGSLPIVSANGAYVVDSTGNTVQDLKLPAEVPDILLDYAEARGIHVNVYLRDEIFASRSGPEYDTYSNRARTDQIKVSDFPFLRTLSPTKILFVAEPWSMDSHEEALACLMQPFDVPVVRSEADYIEFLPAGINKGLGLAALAETMAVKREEVAAIGDWSNDLEMVEWAGIGGAVRNGIESVRKAADLVCATNDEGGVLEFVKYVLNLP